MQHGLRGHVDTLATRVEATNDLPLPQPTQDLVVGIPEASDSQVFFTSEPEAAEPEEVFVVTLPRSRHNEPDSVRAKETELENFGVFDVYEEVKRPQGGNLIDTNWVIVEKELPDGTIVRKARLTMRGDKEKNKHLIPTDSPTVNKIVLKLMLTLAITKGWTIQCADITRAFLQTEQITRDVFVIPPKEAPTSHHAQGQ